MFEFVRKHTKVMMFLMFLMIIPAFVLVGVDETSPQSRGGFYSLKLKLLLFLINYFIFFDIFLAQVMAYNG